MSIALNAAGRKRKIITFAILLIAVTITAYLFWTNNKKASASYMTDTVKRSTITNTIAANGTLEPSKTVTLNFAGQDLIKSVSVRVGDHVKTGQVLAEQETRNLEAQVNGLAANVKANKAKLDLLLEGATNEEIMQARYNVRALEVSRDQAKKTYEMNQALYKEGAVSQADLDNANLNYLNSESKLAQARKTLNDLESGSSEAEIAVAAAQLSSSEAQLQVARDDLAAAGMTCPVDGIVSEVNGVAGQNPPSGSNSKFIVVISEELQIRAQVNEADIGKTEVGLKVHFTVNSFPNRVFAGKVSVIYPEAYTESNVQLYDVLIETEGDITGLKSGMPANTNIIIESRENVLAVPKGAVSYATTYMRTQTRESSAAGSQQSQPPQPQGGNFTGRQQDQAAQSQGGDSTGRRQGQLAQTRDSSSAGRLQVQQRSFILVMDESGRIEPRMVTLGLSDLQYTEVTSGLNEGEKVVIGTTEQAATTSQSQNQRQGQGGINIRTGPGAGMFF